MMDEGTRRIVEARCKRLAEVELEGEQEWQGTLRREAKTKAAGGPARFRVLGSFGDPVGIVIATYYTRERAEADVHNLTPSGAYSRVWIETEHEGRTAEENAAQREIERGLADTY